MSPFSLHKILYMTHVPTHERQQAQHCNSHIIQFQPSTQRPDLQPQPELTLPGDISAWSCQIPDLKISRQKVVSPDLCMLQRGDEGSRTEQQSD